MTQDTPHHETQEHLPRVKQLEKIEATYRTIRASGTPLALRRAVQTAREGLKAYAIEYHNSDPFWVDRAIARLKNGIVIDG